MKIVTASTSLAVLTALALSACALDADIAKTGAQNGGDGGTTSTGDGTDPAGGPDSGPVDVTPDGGPVTDGGTTGWTPIPAADIASVGLAPAGTAQSDSLEIIAFATKGLTTDCVVRNVGVCQITKCGQGGSGGTPVSAGNITVANTMLQPRPDKTYAPVFDAGAWPVGQTLTVNASGADVPTFKASVMAPPDLVVTSPPGGDFHTRMPLTVPLSRTKDFTMTWNPITTKVAVQVYQHGPVGSSDPSYFVACKFDGSAGSGTIPAAALSDLQTGTKVINQLQMNGESQVVQSIGAFAVTVSGNGRGPTFEPQAGIAP